MSIRRIIPAAIALAVLLPSCGKEQGADQGPGKGLPMKVEAKFADDATKVGLSSDNLEDFYLMVDCSDDAFNCMEKITRQGSSWSTPYPFYWKDEITPVTYSAAKFADHEFNRAEFTGGVDLTVPSNQTSEEVICSADLLLMLPTATKYEDHPDGVLPVILSHGLSRLVFDISLGEAFYEAGFGLSGNPVTDVALDLIDVGFHLEPLTGAVTPVHGSGSGMFFYNSAYTPGSAQDKVAKAVFEAIVVPQHFNAGALRVIIYTGNSYFVWTNPTEITFEAGKTHHLPLYLTGPDLTLECEGTMGSGNAPTFTQGESIQFVLICPQPLTKENLRVDWLSITQAGGGSPVSYEPLTLTKVEPFDLMGPTYYLATLAAVPGDPVTLDAWFRLTATFGKVCTSTQPLNSTVKPVNAP